MRNLIAATLVALVALATSCSPANKEQVMKAELPKKEAPKVYMITGTTNLNDVEEEMDTVYAVNTIDTKQLVLFYEYTVHRVHSDGSTTVLIKGAK